MKKCIRHLLFTALIIAFAVPAIAATYDATGIWLIKTDPGETVVVPGIGTIILNEELMVTITQPGGGDIFSFETEPIAELGGVDYDGKGVVSEAEYTFNPILSEDVKLEDIDGLEAFAGISIEVSIAGFELTSANELKGEFAIGGFETVAFTGNPVPVPAAVWLLGSGMIALFGIRKRQNA